MCISPLTLKRDVQTMDGYATDVVPCGKCPECLRSRANAWAFRLYNEMKISENAKMITFTYSEENLPLSFNGLPTLRKKDFQDFMKRYRKQTGKKLKYYLAAEYGDETLRPHYHAVMFNIPFKHTLDSKYIEKAWGKGQIHICEANMKTINYTLKYLLKGKWEPIADYDDREKCFALMSKKMGLNYLTDDMKKFLQSNMANYVTLPGGIKSSLPRYFKDKLFTHSERKQISKTAKIEAEKLEEIKFRDARHKNEWKQNVIRKAKKENQKRKGSL